MLHSPAFAASLGAKPSISAALPSIGSDIWVFDTSTLSAFFTDLAASAPVSASGQAVARVNNLLGGLPYLGQAASSARPTIIYNQAAGRAALRFTSLVGGALQFLSVLNGGATPGDLFKSRAFTALLVVRPTNIDGFHGLFAAGNGNGGQNNTGFDMLTMELSAGLPRLSRNSGSDVAAYRVPSGIDTSSKLLKIVMRAAPGQGSEIRMKCAGQSALTVGPLPLYDDSYPWDTALLGAKLGVGGVSPPLNSFAGDMFEFRFWGARATDVQAAQLQGYADLKWG